MCIGLAFNVLLIQPILVKHIKINKLIVISISVMALMLLLQGISVFIDDFVVINVKPVIWVASCIFYIFMPFVTTGYTAIYSEYSSKGEQGKAMGGLGQVYSLMWFISALFIGGLVLTHESILLVSAGVLALLGALLLYIQFLKRGSENDY
jgi:hypothetical protein